MFLQNSVILSFVYRCWLDSRFFALLSLIWASFKNAYNDLLLVKLLRKPDSVQRVYSNSLFARLLRFICDVITKLVAAVVNPFKSAAETSLILRLCRGSRLLNFEFLLGAFICGMFITPHELWNNSYAVLAAFGFLFLYFIMAGCGKRRLMYPDELGLPFMLFAIVLVLSLLFSHALSDSVRILVFYMASFAFMYVIAADISNIKRLEKLMAFIYIALILTSLYAVAQRVFGLVYVSASFTDLRANIGVPARVTSTLDNPNNFSEFIVLFLPLCAAFAGTRKSVLRSTVLCMGLALPALGLVMTYSRSGWISIMLAAFVYVWLRNKKLIPALIVLSLMAVPFLPDSIMTRIMSLVSGFSNNGHIDTSAAHRLALWKGVSYMIRDYGVTGIGLGPASFNSLYPDYAQLGAVDGAYHTQTLYLELILEVGVLGLVSFIWMALRNIKNIVVARRGAGPVLKPVLIACAAALIGIAFSCCVEYIWFYPRNMFAYFILFGISIAVVNMANTKEIKDTL